MNTQRRWSGKHGSSVRLRRGAGWRHWVSLSGILLACIVTCVVRGEMPRPADFPELEEACRPIGDFVLGNTIVVGTDDPTKTDHSERLCEPFPADSRILAFEENSHFICATGDGSHIFDASQRAEGKPTFVRRVLFLKPSIFVVDDVVRPSSSGGSLRWLLGCRGKSTVAGRQLCIADGDQEFVCETLWPSTEVFRKAGTLGDSDIYQVEVKSEAGADEARWLHVAQLRRAGGDDITAKAAVENKGERCELVITMHNRTFRLNLPSPGVDAGRIAIEDADGKTLIPNRCLPSGVLPHGPEGVKLIEGWDSRYRGDRKPGWDTGKPAEDLKQAVEKGDIRPCRTVVLGCGSGTNAIYLASKGFDVTAIDIAPTALSIAEAKAEKAGVQVRWVLADVLALPKMEPFDLIFDRGCYHNVRYVDAAGFIKSLRQLSRPGTRFFVLSLNRDGPPGVREKHMRDDLSSLYEFEWLRESDIQTGSDGQNRRASWSAMLRRKKDD